MTLVYSLLILILLNTHLPLPLPLPLLLPCPASQSCGALRDVCEGVFGVDQARVTLFWEPGALSRFVKQRLLFNVAEVEARQRQEGLADVRTDAFVYAHFYGLCVSWKCLCVVSWRCLCVAS